MQVSNSKNQKSMHGHVESFTKEGSYAKQPKGLRGPYKTGRIRKCKREKDWPSENWKKLQLDTSVLPAI